jgi:hypothetical protein
MRRTVPWYQHLAKFSFIGKEVGRMKYLKHFVAVPSVLVAALIAPVLWTGLIWSGTFIGVGKLLKERRERRSLKNTCRIDADCPPGYVCHRGQCVPATAD